MSTTSKHILEPLAKEGRRQHQLYACTGTCMYSSKTTFFAKFCDKFTFYSPSAKQDQQTPNMAECYSRPARHFELEHCVRFLEYKNSSEQLEHPAFSRYKTFITSGPDTELLRFQSSLRDHDVKKILLYLRNFEICDLADYERISNDKLFPTSELKVAELVTMISTKDPHAFWYFVHSVKKFRGRNGLFEFFHGNINCCVCEEVHAKEKEIDEALSPVLFIPEENETALSQVQWPHLTLKITNWQLFHTFKRSLECKLKEDIKKEVNRRGKIFKRRVEELRQEVEPPLRELGRIVKEAFKIKDPTVLEEARNSNVNGLEDVVITISNEQPKENSGSSCTDDDSETAVPDEEAGYKRTCKAKPKFWANFEASVDAVEGRKKYIAFVFVSFFTLYSYVDSFVKLIPI
ncbi:uncharacterized protein LOC144665283 isoform X1 [Oculina patagonica]